MSATALQFRLAGAACAALFLLAACQANHTPRSQHDSVPLDTAVLDAIVEPAQAYGFAQGHRIAPGLQIAESDLWADIRAGFRLDRHLHEPRVQQEIRWLERHPSYLLNMETRLARHLAYIHHAVRERGLPSELALLPIVESALDPYAFSHGGAAGLWQFIPATAQRFGLDRNWWYDGRRDPVAATDAALDYLETLYAQFGDWQLALAGYNAGEGNVMRAQKRAPEDAGFFELKLPKETSAYVPRLLALAELVASPEERAVTLPELSPEVPFAVLEMGSQTDLSVISKATGIDLDTLYLWNPALNQWSTPPAGPHQLLLPKEDADHAAAKLAAIPASDRVQWLRVTVNRGDTLSGLARRYRTDVASLRQANNLHGSTITAGDTLLIPKTSDALSNTTIASRTEGTTYVVRSGDSLWTISQAHKVPLNALMRSNHVGPKDYLRVGQKLTLPSVAKAMPVSVNGSRQAEIRKVNYGVRKGDSLARIAAKFNVRVADIVSWNALNPSDYLQPGQKLQLYVNASTGTD